MRFIAKADAVTQDGFNFFAWLLFIWYLPFLVALFGRDRRWKGLTLALCLAAMLATNVDVLTTLCWIGAWASAILAILARLRGPRNAMPV
ncbi:MAG TPA: hypothetical protein VGH70_17505 [Bradyrhizobium sp.]|jgi:hypothetical protein